MTAADIMQFHKEVGDSAPADQNFVYKCLERAFGNEILATQSLRGSGRTRFLDPTTLIYIRTQLNERVYSVGLNAEDREIRTGTGRFHNYVIMCHDKEKKKLKYHQANRDHRY